jgi:SAM-dependent methyltransferase
MINKLYILASLLLKRKGVASFLRGLPRNSMVLDVGCGNKSPLRLKTQRPDIYYIGIDICDYNQTTESIAHADKYIITTPTSFATQIAKLRGKIDAVVSSHNIEHCDQPEDVLEAMLKAIKAGGSIYLSFPCEQSVYFPKRFGGLNFYDGPTHKKVPNWEKIISKITSEGFLIKFSARRYRPLFLSIVGLILEPISLSTRRVMPFATWALYGFESVIWASRPKLS